MTVTLKKHNIPLFIACLLTSIHVLAEDPGVEKKKTYTKSYSVSSSDKISLENQFGELKINIWDKNEVKADITITAEASTDEKAQAILDRISIEDGKKDGEVFFKTRLARGKDNNWEKGEKQRIDYTVYIPSHNVLFASNSFGTLSIGDFNGEATILSKYGRLSAGKLTNARKVVLEYGRGTIASINAGSLIVKYSKIAITNLGGDMEAVFEYCGPVKLHLDTDSKQLNIKNRYSQLYLDVNQNFSANFDIRTSYGNLNNQTSFNIAEEKDDNNRYSPRFNKRYTGKSGNGSIAMTIKSDYGQVTLAHNLDININMDEKKDKEKWKEEDKDKQKDKKKTVRI